MSLRPLATVLAAFAGAALAASLVSPPPAAARQEFAKREDVPCLHCHLTEKGGGPRNEAGKLYEANGFTFDRAAWSGEGAKAAYRRALAAYRASHYAEVRRLLGELRESEKFPGGLALLDALEEQLKPFAPAWLRAAKKNLGGTAPQRATGLRYLFQVLRECPGTPEAKDAEDVLAGLRRNPKLADELAAAGKGEARRLRFLDARLAEETGETETARKAFQDFVEKEPGTPEAALAKERLDLMEAAKKP